MLRSTVTAILILVSVAAFAGDVSKRDDAGLQVIAAWARATPGRVPNGAVFLTIKNYSTFDDRLLTAATPAAQRAELHRHETDGGVMRMRRVRGIDLPAGGTVVFEPGGLHVMLMGLHEPLRKGAVFDLSLVFEKAGQTTFRVEVGPVGAMSPPGRGR